MKFPSEKGCIFNLHNIDERNFSMNHLLNMTKQEVPRHIINFGIHIKEGVLN